MKHVIKLFFFFSLIFNYSNLSALIVGSDSAVSLQSAITFPATDVNQNIILSFGWLANGFTLMDMTTSCTFAGVFPVSGDINLNGGYFELQQDLILRNIASFSGLGTIQGNSYAMELCASISSLPNQTCTLNNVNLYLMGDITINGTLIMQGNSSICGLKHNLILGSTGSIIVDDNATLELHNLRVEGINTNNISCNNNESSLVLDSVVWDQNGSFTFSTGSIQFMDTVSIVGSNAFFYESLQTSTINTASELVIADGSTLWMGTQQGVNPLYFTDNTADLSFDSSTWIVTSSGMNVTRGNIYINNEVTLQILGSTVGTSLTIGDGTSPNDATVQINGGAALTIVSGMITYKNSVPDLLIAASPSSTIIRESSSQLYLATSVIIPEMAIHIESVQSIFIVFAAGQTVEYNNTSITLPASVFNIVGGASSLLSYNLSGSDSIFLTKGVLPLNFTVSNSGNEIQGSGNLSGVITLQDSNAVLTFNLLGSILNSLVIHGSTINLGGNLSLGTDIIITGSGICNLESNVLSLGSSDLSWTSTIEWQGEGGSIELNSQLSLLSTWTIQGDVTIVGNGNILSLGSTGQIVVTSGSSLTLQDVWLYNVQGSNIYCADNTAQIILNGIKWVQSDDFTFNTGSLSIANYVEMDGGYNFIYESIQTSTINSYGTWAFTSGTTLSIGINNSNTSIQPLAFADSTGTLHLDNATFNVTSNGMQLTKGLVEIERAVTIDINSTSTANGLELGDGTTPNNLMFELFPGSSTIYSQGHLTYNVTVPGSISSPSNTANIIRYADSYYYIKQNISLANMTLNLSPYCQSILDPGVTVSYLDTIIQVEQNSSNVTGLRYDLYSNILTGNQSIFLLQGSLLLGTVVSGAGNSISGNGNVIEPIIFQDGSSQLIWDVNGTLQNELALNGGQIILESDLNCTSNASFIGTGTVTLANFVCNLGPEAITWASDIYWDGSFGSLKMNSNIALSQTWTFSGNVTLDGSNRVITLNPGAQIIVEDGSTLTLKDVIIQNVNGSIIYCSDDAGTLILSRATLIQDGDFTFSTGSLQCDINACLKGDGLLFAYQSTQPFTINSESTLTFDYGFTFSYDPSDGVSNDLLVFQDSTSKLNLNNATLYTNLMGLNLTTGYIETSKICSFVSVPNPNLANGGGITLGDGVNLSNDCQLEIGAGSTLQIQKGLLNYNNIDPASLIMSSNVSLIDILTGATLNLYQSLVYDQGVVTFFDSTILGRSLGAQINGTINVNGSLSYVSL